MGASMTRRTALRWLATNPILCDAEITSIQGESVLIRTQDRSIQVFQIHKDTVRTAPDYWFDLSEIEGMRKVLSFEESVDDFLQKNR